MKRLLITLFTLAVLLHPSTSLSQQYSEKQKRILRKEITEACRHAWNGYKTYAAGFDALRPVSKSGHNWYSVSLLMTPVDAFDTFVLLGMDKEAGEAETFVLSGLNFDLDMEVQVFEVNIRLIGGLISAYELTGNRRFGELAADLGRRLLPAFSSPTGMPFRFVNLRTGAVRDPENNPAEIGTCLLEFGKLTAITGDSLFYRTAKLAAMEVFRRRSDLDLIGTIIDVNTGKWLNRECQTGARLDSYFEYLCKAWLLFGDAECLEAWRTHHKAIMKYMLTETKNGSFFTRVDMLSGKETRSWYGALDAFYAGLTALSGDTATAARIQKGNFHMWTAFNIEPEVFNFRTDSIIHPGYPLRPENLESCFYLLRTTGDHRYMSMGDRMIRDIMKFTRTESGFASVKDVRDYSLSDSMESFFLAETLKYAWLIFAPESRLSLDDGVFNTEAHFFRKESKPLR